MKLSTLILAAMTATLIPAAMAQTDTTAVPTTFGTYQLQPTLVAVATTANSSVSVLENLGALQVVQAEKVTPTPQVQTNAVVRNVLTGDLAVVTGRISVLNNDSAAVKAAAARLGLKQLHSFNQGKVLMLQAADQADLLAIQQELKQIGGVVKVRLDVLENKHQAF